MPEPCCELSCIVSLIRIVSCVVGGWKYALEGQRTAVQSGSYPWRVAHISAIVHCIGLWYEDSYNHESERCAGVLIGPQIHQKCQSNIECTKHSPWHSHQIIRTSTLLHYAQSSVKYWHLKEKCAGVYWTGLYWSSQIDLYQPWQPLHYLFEPMLYIQLLGVTMQTNLDSCPGPRAMQHLVD